MKALATLLIVHLAAGTGCIEHTVRPCDDGTVCQIGEICATVGGCSTEALRDACNGVPENVRCFAQDPETSMEIPGVCLGGFCNLAQCGDMKVTAPEACDDGNTANGDMCSADCRTKTGCGNAVIDPTEECDDGNTTYGDGCQGNCRLPICGDGFVDAGETCDMGPTLNTSQPDAPCRMNCTPRRCGDNIVDPGAGEQCDDGNTVDGDGCKGDCSGP